MVLPYACYFYCESVARDVTVAGNYAYVAISDEQVVCTGDCYHDQQSEYTVSLAVYDITDPANPARVGVVTDVSEYSEAVAVTDDVAYWATDDVFRVVAVSDPSAPEVIGSVPLDGRVVALHATDELLLAGTQYGELFLFDISAPRSPVRLSNITSGTYTSEITSRDGIAYVTGLPTLSLVDVRTPEAPRLLCANDTGIAGVSLDVAGDLAYLSLSGMFAVMDVTVASMVDTPAD
jgi:hypothetical protein